MVRSAACPAVGLWVEHGRAERTHLCDAAWTPGRSGTSAAAPNSLRLKAPRQGLSAAFRADSRLRFTPANPNPPRSVAGPVPRGRMPPAGAAGLPGTPAGGRLAIRYS